MVDNSLARSGGNCSSECDGITIIQVNSVNEIPSSVDRFQCTSGLRGDQCRVDYYFTLGQEEKELYVVNTLNGALCIHILYVYKLSVGLYLRTYRT